MNQFSDKILARRMLETRDQGYSLGRYFRKNAKRYVFMVVYFGLSLALLAYLQIWIAFAVIAGLVSGCILRDIGWVRAVGKTWPFSMRITDWAEVERLAAGQPLA
jgi:hypothetical protein